MANTFSRVEKTELSHNFCHVSAQVIRMQHQMEMEGTVRWQLEQETQYLRDQLDQCVKKNGQLEKEALELRYQMIILQSEQSYMNLRAHQQKPEQLKLFQQVKTPPNQIHLPLMEISAGGRGQPRVTALTLGPNISSATINSQF